MRTLITLTLLFITIFSSFEAKITHRYAFYRSMMSKNSDTRRVFGGQAANLSAFPTVAALLDRYWATRCSASIIAKFWALTAAHCVTSQVSYIKYNTRHPAAPDGDFVPVLYLYRHPNYKVVQEDEGRGMDVTLLHHDLGLVRTRDEMTVKDIPEISGFLQFKPEQIVNKELTIIGFGRTESATRTAGEELFSVQLQMSYCDRGAWFHCICGATAPGRPGRGVCSGDSGGPVAYAGIQVGITSMGPLECVTRSDPGEGSTSVFTALYHYVDLINTTIFETDEALHRALEETSTSSMVRLHLAMVLMAVLLISL